MIPFFVTVDTEGDALWDNPKIEDIKTENVLWIPKFQKLCEDYNMIPIWLTDYEIISDQRFIDYIKEKNDNGLCEVGIHVHARNNPPIINLPNEKELGAAYLIEYPYEIMEEKFLTLKNLIEEKLDTRVVSHRAGRWAMNKEYIQLLRKTGIMFDCSVTPGINWSSAEGITPGSKGTDYSAFKNKRYDTIFGERGIVEYPATIMEEKGFIWPAKVSLKSLARSAKHGIKGANLWLRPNTNCNLNELKYVLKRARDEKLEYVEFMIHSSELMPGGGPRHQGVEEVEELFETIEALFKYANSLGFVGHTFKSWDVARNER